MDKKQGQGHSRMTPKQKVAKKRRNIIIFIVELFVLAIVVAAAWIVIRFTGTDHTNLDAGMITDPSAELDSDKIYVNPDAGINVSQNGDIEIDPNNPMSGYTQIALFGVDSRSKKLGSGDNRSDTIIIACINNETKEVKLVSVYRDTYLNLSTDYYNKCNGAFAAGGAAAAITMLNTNLDLAITDYVTVGFTGLIDVIDALGGVWIDVKENEIRYLNDYQISMVGTTTDNIAYYATEGVDYTAVTQAGYQKLNGLQATAYCRIRYVGDDYGRTERQRKVIMAVLEEARKMDANQLIKILNSSIFEEFDTSLKIDQITEVLMDLSSYTIVESAGFPSMDMLTSGTIGGKGSCVVPLDLSSNVTWLHGILFDDPEYVPSSLVETYSDRIESDTAPYLR